MSRLLGLWRSSLLAATFGNGPAADAYSAAFAVPDFSFNLIVGGALNSAFIPVFAELTQERDEREAWRLASITLNCILVLLTLLAIASALFAPLLVHVLAPGFPPATQKMVIQLTRILSL
ncbi:MAG: murein biosynthesis integral membrane protein MurJ, partial [Chloroflexi bacterium]|nr:murein biosynthesis integral membrane protein MurJ [Chloroflexota bacterium]